MLTEEQRSLIKEFITECRADGVAEEQMPFQVSNFVKSLGYQARDRDVQGMAADAQAIKQLVAELSVNE